MSSDCFRDVGLYTERVLMSTQYGSFAKFRKADKMREYLDYLAWRFIPRDNVPPVDIIIVTSWKNAKSCIETSSHPLVEPWVSLFVILCDNSKSQSNAEAWVSTLAHSLSSRTLLAVTVENAYHAIIVWKLTRSLIKGSSNP